MEPQKIEDKPKLNRRITFKQKLFATKYVANGGNGTKTALEVYNTTDPETARSIASENLTKPTVQQAIEETALAAGLTPAVILKEFAGLATHEVEKVSADVKLRGLIEAAKILKMYPSTKHSTLNVSLKGDIKNLGYKEAKDQLKIIDSELGDILDQDEPTTDPIVIEGE